MKSGSIEGREILSDALGSGCEDEGFRTLSRQSLMELCEVVDTEGRGRGGEELEGWQHVQLWRTGIWEENKTRVPTRMRRRAMKMMGWR